MENLLIKIGFIVVGGECIYWGGRIVFSNKYFAYWQNRFWKEKDNNQWSPRSIKINRWGTGLGALLFGMVLIYFVIFQMH